MRQQASPVPFHRSPSLGKDLEELKEGVTGRRTKWSQKEDSSFEAEKEVGEESGAKLGLSQRYFWECQR